MMKNNDVSVSNAVHNFEIISVGEWVLYLFLLSIPLVNIIIMCIWAFGNQANPTKTNFGRAALIWTGIVILFYILFWFLIVSIFFSGAHQGMQV